MSLHNGLDTVAISTAGVFTKTYGSAAPANIANLFISLGFYEDAPVVAVFDSLKRGLNRLGFSISLT